MNGTHHIFQINPAHPLLSVANPATDSQFERKQHLTQCATLRTEHDTGAKLDSANTRLGCRPGRGLPFAAHFRKKTRPRGTILLQQFIPPVAVVTDRRTTNENLWLLFCSGQSLRQIARGSHSTVADPCFLGWGPAPNDAFSRQMDHRIESRNRIRGDQLPRIPWDMLVIVRGVAGLSP